MGKAIVDPEDLRRFAYELKSFNEELTQRSGALQARFQSLGQTWRDQEQRQFAEEFEQTMRAITRFLLAAEQQIPFLVRKAERIDEYLRQR